MSELQFQNIELKDITPDPNQPRKFYDEKAMEELAGSIRESGVLQPILVRKNKKGPGYMLVCGERRYRASLTIASELKERNTIPAVVREIDDSEALQLQIIENLQRKDVHPMEEAIAFKSLLENKQHPLTMEEVAVKVSQTIYYVRQRLKFNSLNSAWQEVFYKNIIKPFDALRIGKLNEKDQQEFYTRKIDKKNIGKPEYRKEFNEWEFNQYSRNLNNAPFEKKDETLNPEMGACTGCVFNSAFNSLFPEDAKTPTCSNGECYTKKCSASMAQKIKIALEDPSVVLVDNESYRGGDTHEEVKKQTKAGHRVYIYSKNEYQRESSNRKDLKQLVASGKILRAFVIAGSDVGKHIYISLAKLKPKSGDVKDRIKSGKATDNDINAEIKRLQEREARSKELDAEKVWSKINELASAPELINEDPLTKEEGMAMVVALHNKIGWSDTDDIEEVTGEFGIEDLDKLQKKLTPGMMNKIFRIFIKSVLSSAMGSHERNTTNAALYKVIKFYKKKDVELIELEQSDTASVRAGRVSKRIAELEGQKKSSSPKKPAAAKTAKKK